MNKSDLAVQRLMYLSGVDGSEQSRSVTCHLAVLRKVALQHSLQLEVFLEDPEAEFDPEIDGKFQAFADRIEWNQSVIVCHSAGATLLLKHPQIVRQAKWIVLLAPDVAGRLPTEEHPHIKVLAAGLDQIVPIEEIQIKFNNDSITVSPSSFHGLSDSKAAELLEMILGDCIGQEA